MALAIRKQYFFLFIIPLLVACGYSNIDEAVPGKFYPHKTEDTLLLFKTRDTITVYATYNWSICDKDTFISEIRYFYIKTLKLRIELELVNTMRLIAANVSNADMFFSHSTTKEIQNNFSRSIKAKGLCVEKLEIFPYNKSLQPTANAPVELNR